MCAAKAVEVINGKQIGEFTLYVRPALKKSEREKELQHEAYKYRASKKRCNLFVKNFTPDVTEQDLLDLFKNYGQVESLKLMHDKDNKFPYAFVCFKTPDEASQVKNAQINFRGKLLYINFYELK